MSETEKIKKLVEFERQVDWKRVLEVCKEGKFCEGLRILHKIPHRSTVPWALFPQWARPEDPVEGCHEG